MHSTGLILFVSTMGSPIQALIHPSTLRNGKELAAYSHKGTDPARDSWGFDTIIRTDIDIDIETYRTMMHLLSCMPPTPTSSYIHRIHHVSWKLAVLWYNTRNYKLDHTGPILIANESWWYKIVEIPIYIYISLYIPVMLCNKCIFFCNPLNDV